MSLTDEKVKQLYTIYYQKPFRFLGIIFYFFTDVIEYNFLKISYFIVNLVLVLKYFCIN